MESDLGIPRNVRKIYQNLHERKHLILSESINVITLVLLFWYCSEIMKYYFLISDITTKVGLWVDKKVPDLSTDLTGPKYRKNTDNTTQKGEWPSNIKLHIKTNQVFLHRCVQRPSVTDIQTVTQQY